MHSILDLPLPDSPFEQQRLLLTLRFYEEAVIRETYDDDGVISEVELSPLDVARALAGLNARTGLLPRNILFATQIGQDWRVGMYAEAATRRVSVLGHAYTIPTPPLVFIGGPGLTYRLYALRETDWPTPKTALYHAPFPNLHANHALCRGNVSFPECTPDTIPQAINRFFDSEFNTDLANGKSRRFPRNVVEMWAALDGEPVWPVDDLLPASITLEEAANEPVR